MKENRFNPFTSENKTFSWWWFGIKVGIVAALIVIWWLENKNKPSVKPINKTSLAEGQSIPLPVDDLPTDISSTTETSEPKQPDNLRKIEGIGPKIQATLQEAGLETFSKIAAMEPTAIKRILVDAGIRLGDPTTWPEQAILAADGKWDELKELQASLKGGRR